MFYNFIFKTIKFLLRLLNGKLIIHNVEYIQKQENFILIAPHTTWLDPLFLAISALPKQFCFMAKKELFDVPILKYFLPKLNVFPVDRENPGPSAIKIPVNNLKSTQLSLIIFPSGSRHSSEVKQGAAMIARLAKVPIIPVQYEGPKTLKEVLLRKKATITFKEPMHIISKEDQLVFSQQIENIFQHEKGESHE